MSPGGPAAEDSLQGDAMENQKSLAGRIAAISAPLAEALRATQELMAPAMDAGTKGISLKRAVQPPSPPPRLPHH